MINLRGGYRTVHVLVGINSPIVPIAFEHKTSAETYVIARGLSGLVRIEPMIVFAEFDDAMAHLDETRKREVLNKLTPEERRIIGAI